MSNYKEIIEKEWEKYQKETNKKYPKILILGGSGSGKSSLINNIFGVEKAKVSNIEPQTEGFKEYKGTLNSPIDLIDSKGYELSKSSTNSQDYINEVNNYLKKLEKQDEFIQVVWFTLSIGKQRIQEMDELILDNILKIESIRKRIMIVLTMCDHDEVDSNNQGVTANKFKEILNDRYKDIKIFETSTDPKLQLELENLIESSAQSIDQKDLRLNFASAQSKSLILKKQTVKEHILLYTAGAGATGAIPIPLSDAVVLTSLQVKMVSDICKIYNLENILGSTQKIVSGVLISQIGKIVGRSLIKFIPVIGTIVGGIINASVASSITYALGMTISEKLYGICNDILNGVDIDLENIFEISSLIDIFDSFYKNSKKDIKTQ